MTKSSEEIQVFTRYSKVDEILDNEERVYVYRWDSGSQLGANTNVIIKFRGGYYWYDENVADEQVEEIVGPYPSLMAAIKDYHEITITDYSISLDCSEMTAQEQLKNARVEAGARHIIKINGEQWVVNGNGGLVEALR